ncbi:ankyrin repeat-containing domain protein [Xylogone sp. PMI_703]|nr:ankyrin repeat-containing domain protein [Xylogone sp. PMI_703]
MRIAMPNPLTERDSFPRLQDDQAELDAKERKRYQNRLAQRNYRRNQKQRLRALEAVVEQRTASAMSFLMTADGGVCGPGSDQVWNLQMNDNLPPMISYSNLTSPSSRQQATPYTPEDTSLTAAYTQTDSGRTALHRAICNGNESLTQILLAQGANIHKQDINGFTALHLAVESGNENLVKLLLENGIDLNTKDTRGRTALFNAVQNENEIMTRMLLEACIDVNCRDAAGEVALHLATERGLERLVLLLLKYGAHVDA